MRSADSCRGRRRVSYRKCWYEIPQGERRWLASVDEASMTGSWRSTCGAWERQSVMNRYGLQVMEHWKRWLPDRYSQIEDPEIFFARMGQEVQEQIEAMTSGLEAQHAQELASLAYLDRVGRLNALQAQASEVVLAEVLLPPEPALQETDPIDPMSEWIDPEGMPVDQTHPLWQMMRDDSVSTDQYRTAYRAWVRQMHQQHDPQHSQEHGQQPQSG